MIASMMMYARPELAEENARYWSLIRDALARRGIEAPVELSNDLPEFDVWQSPDLVFSQTCGMPYRNTLADQVGLIGTPDFGLEGCPPGHYVSAVIVRADDPREALTDFADARFVFNQDCSQSGYGSAWLLARKSGFWFSDRRGSGGHVLSARDVARGDADITVIDGHSWRLIQRYDAHASDLRVIGWTDPTPATPYITARTEQTDTMFDAVAEAIAELTQADRAALGITGVARIPKAEYLAVENPPAP
ncbi:ABC-type phosphate/phosphonate transport system, periplasmic component [Sulfitobacter noctilucae]|uniref:phosphate/phosphite/phosphonate ABC transporter substrate-binding protein n=1 Tax=Sulfitobacter noctilucae TaxID=1342302 RepID=UPI00046A6392|nr:PhnD/SsuA/transferrin family substrate-binding protein [Sulfitobacter noctilucae]KIN75234.1 ABC-type phosphate/phosphonate transport system, periplasmic component [Sulfitobacter noctilucae]